MRLDEGIVRRVERPTQIVHIGRGAGCLIAQHLVDDIAQAHETADLALGIRAQLLRLADANDLAVDNAILFVE